MYEQDPIVEIQRDISELKNDMAETLYGIATGIGKNADITLLLLTTNLIVSVSALLVAVFK
jgi:histidine ammonia-lyase